MGTSLRALEAHELPRHFRELAELAIGLGWVITRTASSHLIWRGPAGERVTTASTPRRKSGPDNNILKLKKILEGRGHAALYQVAVRNR